MERLLRAVVGAGSAVLLSIPLLATHARASVACSYSDPTVTVTIGGAPQQIVLDRASDGTIQINGSFCPGPEPTYATVTNTDLIRITDSSDGQASALWIDLARGGFTPGKTTEPTGQSEIEIEQVLAPSTAAGSLRILGSEASDQIVFGSTGVETNTDGDLDIDFQQIWLLEVTARGGPDTVSGRGSAAVGSAAQYQTYLVANDGADAILAGDSLGYLEGGPGDDSLQGFAGNDYLYGGPGADTLPGGAGSDSSYYGTSAAPVSVDLSASTASGGDAQGDVLSGIEDLLGSDHADDLIGDSSANYISGGAGDDHIEGRGGSDRLQGDTGNDALLGNDDDDSFEQGQAADGADDMHGSSGTDTVWYTQRDNPVSVTRDNIANDGEAAEGDNVHFDIEIARTKESPEPTPSGSGSTSISPTPDGSMSATASPSASPSPSDTCKHALEVTPSERASDGDQLWGVTAGGSGWAVGSRSSGNSERTLVEKWDGDRWQLLQSPNRRGVLNRLNDVDALPDDDVWAVGESGDGRISTLVLRRDQKGWRIVDSPDPGPELNVLSAVEAIGPSNVIAVGDMWDAGRVYRPLIERFNGTRWTIMSSPQLEGRLRDVAGTAGDVWAVGVKVEGGRGRTLIEHFNGSGWRVVASPNEGENFNILDGVAVVSPSEAWSVGYRRGRQGYMQPLIVHLEQDRWKVADIPYAGPRGAELYGVAAVSASDVWAVGDAFGSNQPYVLHFDGTEWTEVDASGTRGSQLLGASARPNGTVWAAGYESAGNGTRPSVLRPCAD